jgi:lysophospholipase
VVHGYGEHGGRYGFLVDAMVPRGYAVFTYDLRGHGRSPGRRGHVERFDHYLADTRGFLTLVGRTCPGSSVVLLGHSMGGLIAAAVAEQAGCSAEPESEALAGLVLSSPFVGMRLRVPPLQVKAARLLSRVAPKLRMSNPLRNDQLSHDPAVVMAAGADPLNHRQTTVRWAAEVLDAQRSVIRGAGRLRLPLLLLYADDDPIADPRGPAKSSSRERPPQTKRRSATPATTTNSSTRSGGRRCSRTWLPGSARACRLRRRLRTRRRRLQTAGRRPSRAVARRRSQAVAPSRPACVSGDLNGAL